MTVDNTRDAFPYQQVAEWIREQIAAGKMGPRLPSIGQLCDQAGVSSGTMQRALAILKADGLIYGLKGLGIFVKGSDKST